MPDSYYIHLKDRAVITVSGDDRVSFLQGLVSGNAEHCTDGVAIWSAMLTPQGKYLFDFFMTKVGSEIWLECEAGRLMDFGRLLHKYKLRANVDLGIGEGLSVVAIIGDDDFVLPEGNAIYKDPRLDVMGRRAILTDAGIEILEDSKTPAGMLTDYTELRVTNGLPDSSKDMIPEKALLMENGFDELSGIDWDKGCYVGQELTARTKYRGLVKKRLLPFIYNEDISESDKIITLDGKEAGEVKTVASGVGLALMRLERLTQAQEQSIPLKLGSVTVRIDMPDWVKIN